MKLVIDTNRIIAALIKASSSREILTNLNYSFITPDFTFEEISKHKKEILKKSGLDETAFDLLMTLIFDNIEVIPFIQYKRYLKEAENLMEDRDIDDAPFLALALAEKADGIWSDDKDFEVQDKIRVFKTRDLIS